MRFLVFMCSTTLLFVGCGPSVNQAWYKISTSNRMEISDGPLYTKAGNVYIIKDNQTEKEFMLVDGPESVAICPIP